MRNPFQSETEAFRFLLVTVAAFAAIALASLVGGVWVGVPVWAVLTVAAAGSYVVGRRSARTEPAAPAHVGGASERRILLVVDGVTVDEAVVRQVRHASSGYRAEVVVVCPTEASRLDHWTSAIDQARTSAQRVLEESLARLRGEGIAVRGEVGDEDRLRAIEDALRTFPADEVVLATPPRLPEGLTAEEAVALAGERFALPIALVVVDAGREAVAGRR
jgi:hypothetical protein